MTAIAQTSATPFLVVFGRDKGGKPHASWFDQASADLARKAAVLMEMHAVPVETDALRELAGTLPRGRVFSSGRAFTPFVNSKLYTRLMELTRELLGLGPTEAIRATSVEDAVAAVQAAGAAAVGGGQANTEGPSQVPSAGQPSRQPTRSDEIGIGNLVLATPGPEEGWWEAEVIGSNGAMLTLRYRDFAEPNIVRRRNELGFLPAASG